METIKLKLESIFGDRKLIVPSYQRAYAWEDLQLKQFIADMLEITNLSEIVGKNGGQYYFGHFILEETNDCFEIIDGQQRITTFIIFLMVCQLFCENDSLDKYIDSFETVDYDQELFIRIKDDLKKNSENFDLNSWELLNNDTQTLSIKRIMYAIKYFKELFESEKNPALIYKDINKYINTFLDAEISIHKTDNKAVAVQIFELQNTRGIKLSLIEKVKSKLMKEIYLNSESTETEENIKIIQREFAEIYRLEELLSSSAFRGDLSLDDILLHHLRMVDDGTKLTTENKNSFNSPSLFGNKEELILYYISDSIKGKSKKDIVDYIKNLSCKFKLSVDLVSLKLPKYDRDNDLIGDVLILEKGLSLELFILLWHLKKEDEIKSKEILRKWERFLFIRNFHDKYFNMQHKDDFELLFFKITKNNTDEVLNNFVGDGFRIDLMDDENLPETNCTYIMINKDNILNNAYHWWSEKMVYLLYKYEMKIGADKVKLREIMKNGRSIEHILPQSWQWEWIGEGDTISEKGKNRKREIDGFINGLGNLLLISVSENSSVSNKHPNDKNYSICDGGSYKLHNNEENKKSWEEHSNWDNNIIERGELIYKYLLEFIKE